MWFKNLRIFRLTQALSASDQELNDLLETKQFQPCGKLDALKHGWTSPLGRSGKMLSHSNGGATMLCAKRQEKSVPSTALNEALENKIYEIREDEGRPVGRKEKQSLKDELIFSMLPQALPRTSFEYGYVHANDRLIYVNVASSKKAEDFLSLLRESLGSVKAVPLGTHNPIAAVLTDWLRNGEAPSPFALGDICELRASKDERVIRFRKHDLSADEIKQHLDTGMHVQRLSLSWKDTISFVIDEELAVKSMSFSDELMEKVSDVNSEGEADVFDNDFAFMHAELSALTKDLLSAFGGEADAF